MTASFATVVFVAAVATIAVADIECQVNGAVLCQLVFIVVAAVAIAVVVVTEFDEAWHFPERFVCIVVVVSIDCFAQCHHIRW